MGLVELPQRRLDPSDHPEGPKMMKGSFTHIVFSVILALSCSSPLSARDWRISSFQDTITLMEDGSAVVQERLTIVFNGHFQGIHRTVPVEYPGPRGTNYTLFVDITGVVDGENSKLKYESSKSGDFRDLKIFIPGATNTTRTIKISYVVKNGVRFFEDHDEFYWNVTGNDWPVPIDHATAFVSLPAKATGSLRAQAFTGVYGSKEAEVMTEVNGPSVSIETTKPLPMRGGLTIDLYLEKGVLQAPSALTRALWFLGGNPIVFLPLWALAVMYVLWHYKGRDPDPGRSVAPMYEPPKDMTPAEAGTLIDDTVDPRDITSTLVDLAVRGYVKIEEKSETTLGIFHHKDYTFHLLKPMAEWQDLVPHERVMLQNVFAGGEETQLSSLKNRFYRAMPVIRQDIMSALRKKGLYLLDPESANGYSIGAGLLIIAPFLVAQFTGYKNVFSSVSLLIGCGVISALIWWLFARQMTAKTVKGGQAYIAVLGFQEFMQRVDADRLKRMPPDTFERYLPYAMALGVEHRWAQAFAGIVQTPPAWYVGPGVYGMGFNPIFFSNSMNGMATDMHQVFVSAPRASSSGSGWSGGGSSSGGGFSGGGFGGGGGSAF